jgi:CubicO group peptidase (beta-lactamase class C family)
MRPSKIKTVDHCLPKRYNLNNVNKRAVGPQVTTSTIVPPDAEIRKILVERIDVLHQSVGIVVGVIGSNGRRVIAQGHLDGGDPRPLNGDTVYEIGSITKVFTSLLLADMTQRGQVSLDDPVAKYLPSTVKIPDRNGRKITLVDLATHTSGLPRMPGNFNPKNPNNPFADYTVEQLYQFLSSYQLPRDIGSQCEYSNLGGGLLGHVMERIADMDYESLVCSRICAPLGMNDTRITLTPEMKVRLAVGHNAELKPVENWDIAALAGAGALRSTVNDLLIFLSANLGFTKSPLAPAMATQLKVRRPTVQDPRDYYSLGWGISLSNGKEVICHSGGTGGYCTWTGYDASARAGVVVLSNTAFHVDDIGLHLLDTSFPLIKQHIEVKVDTRLYDFYVGNYQLGPGFILTVSHEGDRLFTQVTGQVKFEIFPESDRDYFLKAFDSQITFVTGDKGRATELIVHQNGKNTHTKRVE